MNSHASIVDVDAAIRCTVENGVATFTFNRPDAANAFDIPMADALADAVSLAEDDAVRAVLVSANGALFCAGGDVAVFAQADDPSGYLYELASALDSALVRLSRLEKPVVAAVQGAAAGAGMGIVLAADLVVASRKARFMLGYDGIGLSRDCGVSYLLPRAVGQPRALELAITGRRLSADEAHEWGLVTSVVDPSDLQRSVAALVTTLVEGPTRAHAAAKRLIRGSAETSRRPAVRMKGGRSRPSSRPTTRGHESFGSRSSPRNAAGAP